ncbi:hypothetical protein FGO68_gene9012 [Halteria grandinella]|uniref:Uncharacterized protein n=1 Tax=Halteria grandinella TaxID=5974 RepID=A0A8J8NJR4_HALGN|nr:hypothetical protein FGO68_gene9012 [Halteria grandinella]
MDNSAAMDLQWFWIGPEKRCSRMPVFMDNVEILAMDEIIFSINTQLRERFPPKGHFQAIGYTTDEIIKDD